MTCLRQGIPQDRPELMREKHRYFSLFNHRTRGAAQHSLEHAAAGVGAHNDQIGASFADAVLDTI